MAKSFDDSKHITEIRETVFQTFSFPEMCSFDGFNEFFQEVDAVMAYNGQWHCEKDRDLPYFRLVWKEFSDGTLDDIYLNVQESA